MKYNHTYKTRLVISVLLQSLPMLQYLIKRDKRHLGFSVPSHPVKIFHSRAWNLALQRVRGCTTQHVHMKSLSPEVDTVSRSHKMHFKQRTALTAVIRVNISCFVGVSAVNVPFFLANRICKGEGVKGNQKGREANERLRSEGKMR